MGQILDRMGTGSGGPETLGPGRGAQGSRRTATQRGTWTLLQPSPPCLTPGQVLPGAPNPLLQHIPSPSPARPWRPGEAALPSARPVASSLPQGCGKTQERPANSHGPFIGLGTREGGAGARGPRRTGVSAGSRPAQLLTQLSLGYRHDTHHQGCTSPPAPARGTSPPKCARGVTFPRGPHRP